MTFEELAKVNAKLKLTDIKGKAYAEVNERIKAFRQLFPNGTIATELVSLEDGVCVFKATVLNESGAILGTGHAYERENSTFINKTSYIENAETSAVGRALGMVGIGIDTSVASYEEVANAMQNQKKETKTNTKKPDSRGEFKNFVMVNGFTKAQIAGIINKLGLTDSSTDDEWKKALSLAKQELLGGEA